MGSENLAEVSGTILVTGCRRHLHEPPSVVEMSGMPFISFTGIGHSFGGLASVCVHPHLGIQLSSLGSKLWGTDIFRDAFLEEQ